MNELMCGKAALAAPASFKDGRSQRSKHVHGIKKRPRSTVTTSDTYTTASCRPETPKIQTVYEGAFCARTAPQRLQGAGGPSSGVRTPLEIVAAASYFACAFVYVCTYAAALELAWLVDETK